jgi:hypothetical protein
MSVDVATALQRAGQWDAALATGPSPTRRAEILVDRHIWRLDDRSEALEAIDAIQPGAPQLASLLMSQMVYWNQLLKLAPNAYGVYDPVDGFNEALDAAEKAGDLEVTKWATFWAAVANEALRYDRRAAAEGYERARQFAIETGDLLLESYAVRHQGFNLLGEDPPSAIHLLRRSLYLRAAVGARPHTAAAQQALAEGLGDGVEAGELLVIAGATAVELGLTWLLPKS